MSGRLAGLSGAALAAAFAAMPFDDGPSYRKPPNKPKQADPIKKRQRTAQRKARRITRKSAR